MRFQDKVSLTLLLSTLIQTRHVSGSSGENILTQNESNRIKKTYNIDAVTHPPIVITLRPQIQGTKVRTKPNRNDEDFRQTFNFPEVEYPTASTPRPPFHLQGTNNVQRNSIQRASEYPTSTNVKYPLSNNKNEIYKVNYNTIPARLKTTRKPEITVTISGFGATPKPYCFREEGAFPDVEYPLDAKDTWNPNYWKPIPGARSKNEISNKSGPENTSKFNLKGKSGAGTSNQVSATSSKKSYSDKNNHNKVVNSPSSNNNQLNNNYHQVTKKEDPGKKNFVEIDAITNTVMTQTPKLTNQQTTLAPIQSENTKSTTPFLLTPYTTLYFDTTSQLQTNSSKEENKSTTPSPTKTGAKKKKKKPKTTDGQTRSKNKMVQNEDRTFILSPLTTPMPEYQIDFHEPEDSNVTHSTTPSFSEKLLLTTKYEFTVASEESITVVNSSKSDTCPFSLSDPLSSVYVISTTPYPSSDVTLPMNNNNNVGARHNDEKWLTISSDKKVALVSDASNVTDRNIDKYSPCLDDTVVSSNKSSIYDKRVDSTSLPREEVNLPSLDEEFSTDVLPDFDENSMLNYARTLPSTVSLPSQSLIDESWMNSHVIDPRESLEYPDELEQYYIMVP